MGVGDRENCRENLSHNEKQKWFVLKIIDLTVDSQPVACSIEIKSWKYVIARVNDNDLIISKQSMLVNKK